MHHDKAEGMTWEMTYVVQQWANHTTKLTTLCEKCNSQREPHFPA